MFWKIGSREYIKLYAMLEELRLRVERLDLELTLYKNKLKGKKAKTEEPEDEKKLDIYDDGFNDLRKIHKEKNIK